MNIHQNRRLSGTVALAAMSLSLLLAASATATSVVKVYTTSSDFNQGSFNSTQLATPDQITLVPGSSVSFPFLIVANHHYGTISKVDTNTGNEVARYTGCLNNVGNTNICPSSDPIRSPHSYCDWSNSGHCPSRTTIDLNGDIWVANRAFGHQSSVTKIAGEIGHCVDRNGDGIIQTSSDINANGRIDLAESAAIPFAPTSGEWLGQNDECVLFTRPVGSANQLARGITIDALNRIWVSTFTDGRVYVLNNSNGNQLNTYTTGYNIYGLAADALGRIYSSNISGGVVWQMNSSTGGLIATRSVGYNTYGVAVEGNTQKAWLADWSGGGRLARANFDTSGVNTWARSGWTSPATNTRGVAIANDGRIWVSNWTRNTVSVFNPANNTWGTEYSTATGPIGVALDPNNNVWTANAAGGAGGLGSATRINPVTNAVTQSQALGASPYSYSDMSGYQLTQGVVQQGTWSVINDGGIEDIEWGSIFLNEQGGNCPAQGCIPPGTEIYVEARCSNNPQPSGQWTIVSTGAPFSPVQKGRYFEVRAVLRIQGFQAGGFMSPVLTDMRVLPSAPTIASISPASVPVGYTGPITITGKNFTNELTATFSPGITVNSVQVNTVTSVVVNITVPVDRAPGGATVQLNNGAHSVSSTGFTVTLAAPAISSVSPSYVLPSHGEPITLYGENFTPSATLGSSGGSLTNKQFVSLSQMTASFTAPSTPSTINLTVTNATGSATATGAITVYGINSVTADPVRVGESGVVTIMATGLQGDETFNLGGGVNVISANPIAGGVTLEVFVTASAALGTNAVSMTSPSLSLTHAVPNAFTVNPAGSTGPSSGVPTTPVGCTTLTYQNRPYAFCPMNYNWAQAKNHCESTGQQLITVSHAAEAAWLTHQLATLNHTQSWIGLQGAGGIWNTWSDGTAVTYQSWASGQPGGASSGCAYQTGGEWTVGDCTSTRGFACEGFLPTSAPELIALYYFNDGEGMEFSDASGNGFAGMVMGPHTWISSNLADLFPNGSATTGAALQVNTLGSATATLGYAASDAGTAEGWFRFETVPPTLTPIANFHGGIELRVGPNPEGGAIVQCVAQLDVEGSVGPVMVQASFNPAAKTPPWTHIACAFDGEAVKLYVDGAAPVSAAAAGTLVKGASVLWLGGAQFAVDNVAYWGVALTPDTVQEHAEDASVTNNDGQTVGLPAPSLGTLGPNAAGPGQHVVLTLRGSNFTSGASVDLGVGVSVGAITIVNATELTAQVSVSAGAAYGCRNAKITTPFGTAALPCPFSVFGVTSTSPSVVTSGGSGIQVHVTGYGFEIGDIVTMGAGITVVGVAIVSSTEMVVTVDIAAGAVLGSRDVTVTKLNGAVNVYTGVLTVSGPDIILWTTPQDWAAAPVQVGIDVGSKPGSVQLGQSLGTFTSDFTSVGTALDAGLGFVNGGGVVSVVKTAAGLQMSGFGGGCVHRMLPSGSSLIDTTIKVLDIQSPFVELLGFGPPKAFGFGQSFFDWGYGGLFMTIEGALGWYQHIDGQLKFWTGSGWSDVLSTFASGLLGIDIRIKIEIVDGKINISIEDPLGTAITIIAGLFGIPVPPGIVGYIGTVAELAGIGLGNLVPQVINMLVGYFNISDPFGFVDNFVGGVLGSAWKQLGGLFGGGISFGGFGGWGGGGISLGWGGGGGFGKGWKLGGGGGKKKSSGKFRLKGGGGGGGSWGGGWGGGWSSWSFGWGFSPGGSFSGAASAIFQGALNTWTGSGLIFNHATGQIGWCDIQDGIARFWNGVEWVLELAWIPNTFGSLGAWFDYECSFEGGQLSVNLYNSAGVLINTISAFPSLPSLQVSGEVDFFFGSPVAYDLAGLPMWGDLDLAFFETVGDIMGFGYNLLGRMVVGIYDALVPTNWGTLTIGTALPTGTTVRLQLRCGNSPEAIEAATFLGPDGTSNTWFTGGELIGAPFDGYRYIQWQAELSTEDPNFTPEMLNVIIPIQEIPTISSLSPSLAYASAEAVPLTIYGTAFDTTTQVTIGDWQVLSVDVQSQTMAVVTVLIPTGTTPGTVDVTVTTSAGTTQQVGGFGLRGVTGINTTGGEQGQTLVVELSGVGLHGPATLDFGPNITVSNVVVNSSTKITATLYVDTEAFLGDRDIHVTFGGATSTLTGQFSVLPDAGCTNNCNALGLTKVFPGTVTRGGSTQVVLQGTFFGSGLGVTASGGVTVSGINPLTSKQAQVTLSVPADAPSSFGLTLTRAGQTVTVNNVVKVLKIDSLSATTLPLGATTTLTIHGEGFLPGLGLNVNMGPHISTQNTILSETQIRVVATVSTSAVLGHRTLSLQFGGPGVVKENAFAVVGPGGVSTPTLATVTPNKGLRGETLTLTLNGTNFSHSMSALFGVGMGVSNVQVQTSSQLTLTLAIAPGTNVGWRDVTVNTLYGSALRTQFFLVQDTDPCSGVVCNTPPTQCFNTAGTCVNGGCEYTFKAAGSACASNNACTVGATCDGAGGCGQPNNKACNDTIPCTVDVCNPITGCESHPSTELCADFTCPKGGDVDGSGAVNVADAMCSILVSNWWQTNYPVEVIPPPACLQGGPTLNADMNCSGTVNVADAQIVIQLAMTGSFSNLVDHNRNACVDTCDGEFCGDGICDPQESCIICPEDCGSCAGSCCVAHSTYGCGDATIMACVCSSMPECCSTDGNGWTTQCVNRAKNHCGADCE